MCIAVRSFYLPWYFPLFLSYLFLSSSSLVHDNVLSSKQVHFLQVVFLNWGKMRNVFKTFSFQILLDTTFKISLLSWKSGTDNMSLPCFFLDIDSYFTLCFVKLFSWIAPHLVNFFFQTALNSLKQSSKFTYRFVASIKSFRHFTDSFVIFCVFRYLPWVEDH